MLHYAGETINIYDGDFIGWTTATLVEKVGEIGSYERWIMITREGSELRRLVGFDEKLKEKPTKLYRPILFRREWDSDWEEGTLIISDNGETIIDKEKIPSYQVYEYKSNWF